MQYSINVAGVLLSISDVLRTMPIAPLLTRISGQFSCSSEWVSAYTRHIKERQ
jgi:hypothetical protein